MINFHYIGSDSDGAICDENKKKVEAKRTKYDD